MYTYRIIEDGQRIIKIKDEIEVEMQRERKKRTLQEHEEEIDVRKMNKGKEGKNRGR